MRTFDEAVELISGPKDQVDDFRERHQDFMLDILRNPNIAFFSGKMIRARIPDVRGKELQGAITLCIDMLFTGLVLGMAMKGDDDPQ